MIHLPGIIHDLALILIVAGAMTLLFRAIRQPVVLGYIIAGFLVGPSIHWLPSVVDTESVKIWAEIGVIFLLFALGLEFSFKKLVRVGAPASITAVVEVAGMVAVGYLIGQLFSWNHMDSLFLGGILAISSTTIIIRAFDELGLKTRGFARLVFGVLIVEDLVAILLMVILSTVAATRSFSGTAMGASALKLGFFLALWFILGIFLVPTFLKKMRNLLSAETLLVVSLGFCFLMVVLATEVGFSPALGAFIMGSILAETHESDRVEHLIQPVKDLFAAIFFVSVGMLIDVNVLSQYWAPILVITLATVVGKLLTTTLGALMSGQSLRHSVQTGMSLAQIGEFSFIIASLGLSLKVTSDFLFPIAISVSAITTFTTPYLIRSADRMVTFLERVLPHSWLAAIDRFHRASSTVGQVSEGRNIFRAYAPKFLANMVVVIFIFLMADRFLSPFLISYIGDVTAAYGISLAAAMVLSAPFLWAMVAGRIESAALTLLWNDRRYRILLVAIEGARWGLTLLLIAGLSGRFVSAGKVVAAVLTIGILAILLLSRYVSKVYVRLERRFMSNLNSKETEAESSKLAPLAPWDAHLAELTVSPNSPVIGKKLIDAKIRERFGVSIALIQRGRRTIAAPGRDEALYPGDTLQVIGTDEQIHSFKQECEALDETIGIPNLDYTLKPLSIATNSPFAQKTIHDSGLREATKGLVVGIEKKGTRSLNPDSKIVIEAGDIIWLVGERTALSKL